MHFDIAGKSPEARGFLANLIRDLWPRRGFGRGGDATKRATRHGQTDLLRSRLDAIIDMEHALVRLARTIDWPFLEERFGAAYEDKPGRPPQPTRLMAGAGHSQAHLRPL
jgi:hypothetical protein